MTAVSVRSEEAARAAALAFDLRALSDNFDEDGRGRMTRAAVTLRRLLEPHP